MNREKAIELLLEDIKDLGNRLSAVDQWPVQRKQIRAIIDKSTQALAALKPAEEPDKISEAIELLERAREILDTMDSMEDDPIEICCNTEALKGIIPEALALLKPAVCETCGGSGQKKVYRDPAVETGWSYFRSFLGISCYFVPCPDCKSTGSGQAEVGEKQLIIVRPRGIGKMVEWVKKLRPEVHIQESDCQKKLQQQQADIDRLEVEKVELRQADRDHLSAREGLKKRFEESQVENKRLKEEARSWRSVAERLEREKQALKGRKVKENEEA